MRWITGALSTVAVMLSACATAPVAQDPQFTASEVREDLGTMVGFVKSAHLDLARSADLEALAIKAAQVRSGLPDHMDLRSAWMALASLNPLYGDAHTGLRRPVAAIEAFQAAGGRLFPAPVVFDRNGGLRIAPGAPAELGVTPGAQVLTINGIGVADIVAQPEPRMRGESDALRRLILARYFAEYHWLAYGGFDSYRVRVLDADGSRRTVRLGFAPRHGPDDPGFRYQRFSDGVALLTVPTFELAYREQFSAFLARAFADIQDSGVGSLIIDLRENGGGARDLSDILVGYISSTPVATTSQVTARVAKENVARLPGAKLGAIITLPIRQKTQPPPGTPRRFEGAIYVLVGKLTYSQAIVFAATLQDHHLAIVAGEETEGPANQTAQVQSQLLPHTKMEVLAPLYVLTRASGREGVRGLMPDLPIEDDPTAPIRSVERLRAAIAER